MKFTQMPSNTLSTIQLNAGVIASDFAPETGTVNDADIIGATSGGVSFTATPSYIDFGEDIDNCPKNTKELKKIDAYEVKLSGSLVTVTPEVGKKLVGAATLATNKITPKAELASADFDDLWWIGDYSDKNGATNGGFIAIHMLNALSTGGFQIQSTDKEKGKFAFEFTAHTSLLTPDVVPFEVYIKAGTAEL